MGRLPPQESAYKAGRASPPQAGHTGCKWGYLRHSTTTSCLPAHHSSPPARQGEGIQVKGPGNCYKKATENKEESTARKCQNTTEHIYRKISRYRRIRTVANYTWEEKNTITWECPLGTQAGRRKASRWYYRRQFFPTCQPAPPPPFAQKPAMPIQQRCVSLFLSQVRGLEKCRMLRHIAGFQPAFSTRHASMNRKWQRAGSRIFTVVSSPS